MFRIEVFGQTMDFMHFNFAHLALLILALAELALFVVALVACARSRIQHKGLWIAIILLVQLTLKLTGTAFDAYVLIIDLSFPLETPWTFSFALPLGAILFLCMKKRLELSAEQERQKTTPESGRQ